MNEVSSLNRSTVKIHNDLKRKVSATLGLQSMNRRICSYDRLAVPESSFVLKDNGGEMYFCNARCFGIWAILWATRPDLTEEQRAGEFLMTTPVGEQ